MGGNEVLQHRKTFAEIRGDRRFDDLTGGLGHKAAHPGELANLLLGTASARVGHDIDRVEDARLIGVLHVVEHFVGNLLGYRRPDLDHLVVALAVGDRAVKVLLLYREDLLLGVTHQGVLGVWNDHVVQTNGETAACGVLEAEILNPVQHLDCHFQIPD